MLATDEDIDNLIRAVLDEKEKGHRLKLRLREYRALVHKLIIKIEHVDEMTMRIWETFKNRLDDDDELE